ncbi:MAG: FHA domain-containing protein [Deltaproteobacteria bacterium]|nr:MAG: FHA domain-containing protein [Deltaproteobacteria bacterium]TMB34544.1 MAG: FHA domain-containing protein [Deltaproteobacteria bacterium]
MAEAIAESRALHVVENAERVTAVLGHSDPPAAEPLELRWQAADGADRRLRLDGNLVSLGAHPRNDVHIPDRFVSRYHCRLHGRHGRLWIQDLGSTNGTVVDGARVSEAEIGPGSLVRIGGQVLRVEREYSSHPVLLPGVITRDPALGAALDLLKRAAPSRLPVLIQGESGSGKEVAARAVHELSSRAAGPFVPVNCGAIAAEVAEAELFGHERGAFTGAVQSSIGAFGAAESGTLFLDEIGDLPLALQVKLLRALESGEVKPVGAPRPRRMDVRVVCATHRDLRAEVRRGAFREDLYYRLCGVVVRLPPLRERPGDILPLAEHFLALEGDGVRRTFSADARAALSVHPWPGNARELRHVVQLAIVLNDSPVIRASGLRFGSGPPAPRPRETPANEGRDVVELRGRTLEELEAIAIRAAFERHRGHRRAIIAELGISRSNLLRKLDQLGLRSRDEGVS